MKVVAVPAALRFDRVAFSNEIVHGEALGLSTIWRCPRCSEAVKFTKADFEERAARRISNLEDAYVRSFDAWAEAHGEANSPFLDWRCPGCDLAVRVYAHPWAGGRFGDAGVNLGMVLEGE